LGEKTPAISASQERKAFTRLLRDPPPSPERIAAEITRVLWWNQQPEARSARMHRE